ncbi:hypothetical protein Ga0123462_1383 [Mariprofundus ferrinatatus]|uniref:UDP:flavonoid glycosyltransferase YjiC, YdhE family n=1 Tax=Mariprofundus ferrinatatus TaxID=1921087 RepID=A0A2K8LD84_9PROT|nr:hypothetical protein [Mariprofundus ferrinatatus]ATX82246.1 hypothetical protein Ga0123462_1383 [Mariprofundus ferrinatatus]
MRIAVYISGHGFGHLAQMAPVLNRLYQKRPECQFLIRCALPESELRGRLDFDFELESEVVDLGVIQKSAVDEDREGSIDLMRGWTSMMPELIARDAAYLKNFAPDLVLSNISPLAFPAAKTLGVPAVGLATLDWHTIYSHWLDAGDPVIKSLKQAYEACDLLLTPPMAMDMQVFSKQQHIPLLVASPNDNAFAFKAGYAKRALVIFGGSRHPAYDISALADMPEWLFMIPDAPAGAPENVQSVGFSKALRPIDLMPHVDAVVCKPGYGVLAECWRTETPMAWVERPDFPEFPMLKVWLEKCFPSCGMSRSSFQMGDWLPALDGALASQRQFPALEEDGADVAARAILSLCQQRN